MIQLQRDRRTPGAEILTEYPHQFVRGTFGRYVHRPRSAAKYAHHTSIGLWCGMSFGTSGVIGADRVADFGENAELCGTCEGRFLGSLDNTGLIFAPSNAIDQWRPGTKWCPGPNQELYIVTGPRSLCVCLLCGASGNERAKGGGWTSWGSTMTRHHYASAQPKVFCPTCGYRDLRLHDDDLFKRGKFTIVCTSFRCTFRYAVPGFTNARRPLLPPSPSATRYDLPPPTVPRFEGFDQGLPDNFDDLFDDLLEHPPDPPY